MASLAAIKLVKIDITFFFRQVAICHVAIEGDDSFSRPRRGGNRKFFIFHVMPREDEIEGTCDFVLVPP